MLAPLQKAISTTPTDGLIVVLTGAGISKESGLDTFRDSDGIWATVRVEDVATPLAFKTNPLAVHGFHNDLRRILRRSCIQPNPAHSALARLEREWPGRVLVVTQNIDNLHERAGTSALVHMHGELTKVRCQVCNTVLEWKEDLDVASVCPACLRSGILRPHVVWFGEMPLDMDIINAALTECALFVSIGTSGNVYPAANFVNRVRRRRAAHTVELNLEPSETRGRFAEARHGQASLLVPAFVDELLVRGIQPVTSR